MGRICPNPPRSNKQGKIGSPKGTLFDEHDDGYPVQSPTSGGNPKFLALDDNLCSNHGLEHYVEGRGNQTVRNTDADSILQGDDCQLCGLKYVRDSHR